MKNLTGNQIVKNILIIMNYRPNRGGVTDQVLELITELEKENYKFRIISTHGRKINRLINSIKAVFIAGKYDLVIGIGSAFLGFLPCIVASLSARFNNKPVLYNFHDGQSEIYLQKYNRLIKTIIKNSIIVCASDFVADSFKNYNLNAVKIPYHFDFNKNFYHRNTGFRWNKKVIWARSFYELYQPEIALEAALKVLQKDSEFEFHFYGEGPMFMDMKNKYQHNGIIFHGFVPRNEFLKQYENFAILINTTCYDNFPLSIVEAGYNELCVLSTRIGGIKSIYAENELVFFNDENDLAEKLLSISVSFEKFDTFRFNLKGKVAKFSWNYVKEDWLKIINALV